MTRVKKILATLMLLAAVVVLNAKTASAAAILIVGADGAPPTAELLARGYTTVDFFNSTGGTPTLVQLNAYDAVLAYTNFVPANAVALGDVLADYVDAGGQLALATYSFSNPWAVQGRITTAGYAPLVNLGTNGDVSGNLVAVVPGDPIFVGVNLAGLTYFHNSNFAHPGLAAGATLLATDGGGVSMIARNAAGNVIGLNLFPGNVPGGNNGEFYDLLANSLVPVPEPISLSLLGVGLAGVALRRRARRN